MKDIIFLTVWLAFSVYLLKKLFFSGISAVQSTLKNEYQYEYRYYGGPLDGTVECRSTSRPYHTKEVRNGIYKKEDNTEIIQNNVRIIDLKFHYLSKEITDVSSPLS